MAGQFDVSARRTLAAAKKNSHLRFAVQWLTVSDHAASGGK